MKRQGLSTVQEKACAALSALAINDGNLLLLLVTSHCYFISAREGHRDNFTFYESTHTGQLTTSLWVQSIKCTSAQ